MMLARMVLVSGLCVLLAPLAVCWGLWAIFAVLALVPGGRRRAARGGGREAEGWRGMIDILIPAHDEELLLPRLLESLAGQTAAGARRRGRMLVVADHCSDQTAALARLGGAEVLERGSGPRGKPAALRDGLALLGARSADRAVLILDADCTVSANLLEALGDALDAGHTVAQAAYILDPGQERDAERLHTPAMIAFALKNMIRPKGMARLGVPTQLFGTGMCFRGDVLERISFADHLTEDLKISHDLLLAGINPVFVAEAIVRSPLPGDRGAMSTQKLRWETGQVQTWGRLPGMLVRLLSRGRVRATLALVDWSSPPVAMAVCGWLVLAVGAGVLTIAGLMPGWAFVPLLATLGLFVTYVILGASQIAGPFAAVTLVVGMPRFVLWKLALYGRMLTGRGAKTWDRTPRSIARQGEP
ncbi:MAG TPA: glycosyltransferase family 2 protein [Phycisphaerae bacterium]|nr:glycosyltransferase family 2 protein [Phycisphaerae bacterium]